MIEPHRVRPRSGQLSPGGDRGRYVAADPCRIGDDVARLTAPVAAAPIVLMVPTSTPRLHII
jgi:hypothetical protein